VRRSRALKYLFAGSAGIAVPAFIGTGTAFADEEGLAAAAAVQATLDNIWILIAAVLVIFMQAGFALVEAGLTRAKSVANIFMKNLMDFCVGALLFFAVGYAIAFGGDFTGAGKFIGGDGWFLAGDGCSPTAHSTSSCSSRSRLRSPPRQQPSCPAPWPSVRSSRAT